MTSLPAALGRHGEIDLDLAGRVATVTLNRPDRNNAWTQTMESAFFDAIQWCSHEAEVRAVVITGAGRSFCPGLDVDVLTDAEVARAYRAGRRSMTALRLLSKPTIAAINGGCAGVGFILAAFSDVRFASSRARLSTSFSRLGLPAEDGLSWILPRLIGGSRAVELLLSGRAFSADEALSMGFVHEVHAPDDLQVAVADYAADLATRCSPVAIATIKQQLRAAGVEDLESSRRAAVELVEEAMGGTDVAEGLAAYIEGRDPHFAPWGQPSNSSHERHWSEY